MPYRDFSLPQVPINLQQPSKTLFARNLIESALENREKPLLVVRQSGFDLDFQTTERVIGIAFKQGRADAKSQNLWILQLDSVPKIQ